MDRSLTWTIEESEGPVRVVLSGELTENANLGGLIARIGGAVVFDLAGIQRINSPGVREWITFVRSLDEKGLRFSMARCSVGFVNQLNMIANFRGKGEIVSFFAPYHCSRCVHDETRLIDAQADQANPRAQIERLFICPKCGEPMEFDDVVDAYLAFRS